MSGNVGAGIAKSRGSELKCGIHRSANPQSLASDECHARGADEKRLLTCGGRRGRDRETLDRIWTETGVHIRTPNETVSEARLSEIGGNPANATRKGGSGKCTLGRVALTPLEAGLQAVFKNSASHPLHELAVDRSRSLANQAVTSKVHRRHRPLDRYRSSCSAVTVTAPEARSPRSRSDVAVTPRPWCC